MKKAKIRKILIEAGILIAVFLIAAKVFGYTTNRGKESMTADMAAATFPQVCFSYAGYELNPLPGYAGEMDMAAMRDTITPVSNQRIELILESEDPVQSAKLQIYTLDGQEELTSVTVDAPADTATFEIEDETILSQERMMQLVLQMESGESRYYYTRLVDSSDKNIVECLDYIRTFHEDAIAKSDESDVSSAIETDDSGDNTTYQHVTIHSDYDHVSWGTLAPTVVEGSERWLIKEMNSVTSSVQLQFQARCENGEDETDLYKVKEFFRIRYRSDAQKTVLLDYDRTMEQVFQASEASFDKNGILLGIADADTAYLTNTDGAAVAFVQADELWSYRRDTGEAALIFTFSADENNDPRNETAQHTIRLLYMDDDGNLTFTVCGYMNRGEHEGEVGTAVYYYDIEENTVEERAFLSTDQAYDHAQIEMGNLMYYSADRDVLYTLSGGTLYQVTVGKNRIRTLAEDLADDEYVISDDGRYLAYASGEGEEKLTSIQVLDLFTGDEQTVSCEDGETLRPLGFMDSDFVYGVCREDDAGSMISGESVEPMYKLKIQNRKGKNIKTYEYDGIYVLSVEYEGNMITLNCAVRDGTVYSATAQDYITNNEAEETTDVYTESYTTDQKGTQVRLTFREKLEKTVTETQNSRQMLQESPKTFTLEREDGGTRYYVYGYGRLQGIYEKAGDAIVQADAYNGVVVDSAQSYIWERGNRDLQYTIADSTGKAESIRQLLNAGTYATDAAAQVSGTGLDLTGCTPEELMYVINQDRPVIAMTGTDESVILYGYTETKIRYIETKTGAKKSVTLEKLDQMTEATGHMYIG